MCYPGSKVQSSHRQPSSQLPWWKWRTLYKAYLSGKMLCCCTSVRAWLQFRIKKGTQIELIAIQHKIQFSNLNFCCKTAKLFTNDPYVFVWRKMVMFFPKRVQRCNHASLIKIFKKLTALNIHSEVGTYSVWKIEHKNTVNKEGKK